jgi:Cytochrome bd terminal oxidase subunit I
MDERHRLPRPLSFLVEDLRRELCHGRRLRSCHGLSVRHQLELFLGIRGSITGRLLTYEVLTAFFLEAGFLGVTLFGWNKVGPGLHLFATIMVATGTLISASWILASNRTRPRSDASRPQIAALLRRPAIYLLHDSYLITADGTVSF